MRRGSEYLKNFLNVEHAKIINEEVVSLSEQCKVAMKEKAEAETRLEVLSKFFNEKEAERQKEESMWLQQQGEVSITVEKLQMMQSEIQNYKLLFFYQ